jgi:hypothetical protein
MTLAMEVLSPHLPHPVGSARVQSVVETILRCAKDGERDAVILARISSYGTSHFTAGFFIVAIRIQKAQQWSLSFSHC